MSDKRLNVFPSRMVMQTIKGRLNGARKGYQLLKKKSDAIKNELNKLLKAILECKRQMGVTMKDAAHSHTDAVWSAGNFNDQIIENVQNASYKTSLDVKNIAGVQLPIFERMPFDQQEDMMVGLSKGGQQVIKCKTAFTSALDTLIELASLQTSLKTLDDALRVTNRRVNALEYVVIPKLENTLKYINGELEELEREEFTRLKKVRDMVQTAREAAKAEEDAKELLNEDVEEDAPNMLEGFNDAEDLVVDQMF